MSRYIMIRRLRGPAFLLLVGVLALLHQMGVINSFWHLFWPLLLIMLGVLLLAERAALAAEGGYPPMPYPGQPYPGQYPAGAPQPGASAPTPAYEAPNDQGQPTALVPRSMEDPTKESKGGRL
jgi:hypothetical protein